MQNLKQALDSNKKIIDQRLTSFFENKANSLHEIDPIMYGFVESIADQVLRSGKRIRPFLSRIAYEYGGGENADIVTELSLALELLHQFFMVHDDIVDRDEKRYGGDSLHVLYHKKFKKELQVDDPHFGLSIGILAGDLLHSLAVQTILQMNVSDEMRNVLTAQLIQTIHETTAGWKIHFFMNQKSIDQVQESEFLRGMELVSAKYTFVTPMLLGLILADSTTHQEAMETYAYHTGMAYQIGDDILGMFGNPEITGKPAGNDYREGKKTLLVMESYRNATTEQKMYIKNTLGKNIDQKELSEIRDLMIETGGLEYSKQIALDHAQKAKAAIGNLDEKNGNQLQILNELVDYVLEREK
jgi:geranylgeranyl diphosphate synthase type I